MGPAWPDVDGLTFKLPVSSSAFNLAREHEGSSWRDSLPVCWMGSGSSVALQPAHSRNAGRTGGRIEARDWER